MICIRIYILILEREIKKEQYCITIKPERL